VGDRGRLVVFIDDLDRCTPDKVPEVLEAIKLFTTTPRCVYVLGLDHDIVRQGIKAKYQFETPAEATEYLEKVVQIPFHLPPLDQGRVETFVREYYPDLRQVCPTAPDVFSRGLEPNPRKVKRALNVYRTLLGLAEVRVDAWEMDPVEPELVAKMVVIESRFRPLHRHLVKEAKFLVKLDECLPEPEAGTALRDDELIQALEKDEEVRLDLIREPAATESDAKSGLVDRDSAGALAAMLLAGKKRFKDQPLDQIRSYIYLSATTEGGAEGIRPNRREREKLLGNDRDDIKTQVDEILRKGADEQAQEGITQDYLDRLQGVLDHRERYTFDEWKSADTALSLLGVLKSGETLEGVRTWVDGSGDYGTTQILWANKVLDAYGEESWERQKFEPETLRVPAGQFLMGSDPKKDKDAEDDEQPQHTLDLPAYRIARAPVTNAQYLAFVQAAGHRVPEHWEDGKPPGGKEEHPVVLVSWHDAMAYCRWLGEATGRPYRLPSEAEWEKAARGTDGRIWPWGDEWEKKLCNSAEGGPGDTTPVGQYSPGGDSPYGCMDMAGNVWEWTPSVYRDYPYDPEDGREDPKAGGPFALRGGSWLLNRRIARVSYRSRTHPVSFNGSIGFRVVVAPVLSS
jgi:formylglycine-generating enzyme required for sulfatase activity